VLRGPLPTSGRPDIKQIHDYLAEVDRDEAESRFGVKGIVITGRPMPLASEFPIIGPYPVKWLTYGIDLTLAET
jgi:hypothetical protein